jgi:putative nucleotidyltransferase with HDIG domain
MLTGKTTDILSSALGDLPSISPVLMRLSKVTSNPASTAQQVADVVKLDPALSAKMLRLANSAYIGIPRTIDSLKNAVVLLGQKRIYSVALTSGVLLALKKRGEMPFSPKDYWRHSVAVGMIAELVSKSLRRRDFIDSDEAFTAGLLHDIGKLALGCFGADHIKKAAQASREQKIPFFKAEKLNTSHTMAGMLLAKKWNFPPGLCVALSCHHDPAHCAGEKRMVSLVHLSDGVAHLVNVSTFPGETPPQLDADAIALVNVQPELLRAIAGEALQNEKRMEALIECIG